MKIQVLVSEYGYVYGFIPANYETTKSIGFLAHVDTAPDASGENVNPRIIEKYDGKEIKLNEK
jgi:tripeptide aminopeptidase